MLASVCATANMSLCVRVCVCVRARSAFFPFVNQSWQYKKRSEGATAPSGVHFPKGPSLWMPPNFTLWGNTVLSWWSSLLEDWSNTKCRKGYKNGFIISLLRRRAAPSGGEKTAVQFYALLPLECILPRVTDRLTAGGGVPVRNERGQIIALTWQTEVPGCLWLLL